MGGPLASVIIPLFNNVVLTQACLEALVAATPEHMYDVVLVDNGSTDGTGDLLDALAGDVTIIRNRVNRGVAGACNQGAAGARGEDHVFLNNDTEPLPGWFEPPTGRADGDPPVGPGGPQPLFPDATGPHAAQ